MITTRPTPPVVPKSGNPLPSTHAIGDEVIFVPASQVPNIILAQGVACKIVGVTFEQSKVLYDLALPIDAFDFYEEYPLMRVDSVFVFDKPQLLLSGPTRRRGP